MTHREFDQVLAEYGDGLYGFCVKLTGSRHDADDLWQDTILRAFQRVSRIRRDGNPKGYLYALCISQWKSDRRRLARVTAHSAPWESTTPLDTGQDPEADVLQEEQTQAVNRAVEALSETLRLPVYLHYTVGLELAEIARVLGLPKGTVKSRLFRARGLIQQRLESECFER